MVCYLTPTCNRFTAEDCKERYTKIKELYEESGLQRILGPLVGASSDGDARRRGDQVQRKIVLKHGVFFRGHLTCLSFSGSFVPETAENRYKPVNHKSFVYSAAVMKDGRNPITRIPHDLSDQDWLQYVLKSRFIVDVFDLFVIFGDAMIPVF
jgi:hypothetical protein